METLRIGYGILKTLCTDIFERLGFSDENASVITDVLLRADLYGIESHGVQRLMRYKKAIAAGSVDVHARPETVFETPVSAVIDAHGGMGQLIAYRAMSAAIEKARKTGMAIVTVRNSNHYGIAGYYAQMACDRGLIGISMTNTESIMVHTYSSRPLLGSNPIAVAFPADPIPFYFDAATTVVPRGKLEVYAKREKPLPEKWALDENGQVCDNSPRVLDNIIRKSGGGILPVGGESELTGSHKGYGYAMICELFTAILSGGDTSNHHVRAEGRGAGTCHGFAVIDPAAFGDPQSIKNSLSRLLEELREAPKAEGQTRIYTHGEKEIEASAERMRNGILVNPRTLDEIREICADLGMDAEYYLNRD